MKLSVIVPVYNVEEYICECINSIICQTYKDLEIIIIDDGSTDNSGAICDEFANKDSRIKVFHKANNGVSSTRNTGIELSTGELITFVDSDDTLDCEMYETLVSIIINNNVDIAHCSYKRIDGSEIKKIGDSGKLIVQDRTEGLECLISGRLFVGSMWNKIYKKELIKNIRLREELVINEDVLFNIQAFDLAQSSGFIDKCLYNYFVRTASSATNTTKAIIKARDSAFVSEYIYYKITDKPLVRSTTNRYVNLLCNLYRVEKDLNKRQKIIKKMFSVNKDILDKNNKVSIYLIKYAPPIYKLIYTAYDRIRIPNWDVK